MLKRAFNIRGGVWFSIAALLFALVVGGTVIRKGLPSESFKAFYCAGFALNQRQSPYTLEPLRSCEHRIYQSSHFPAYLAEPAPLPGYAIVPVSLLARFDAARAQIIFIMLTLLAVIGSAWLLADLTGLPAVAVLVVLSPVAGLLNISYGEIPPFTLFAITLAGWLLARRQDGLAGLSAIAAMVQPHVGLPVCAALFLLRAGTRKTLAVGAVVLGLISVVAVGAAGNVLYFREVLPLQAWAELAANDQYSLSRVLHLVGMADRLALALGTVSYVVMCALGIAIARRSARRIGAPELIAFVPAALVLLAGTFVHNLQMIAAIPAAIVLAARSTQFRIAAGLALVALIVAWEPTSGRVLPLLSLAGVFAAVYILARFGSIGRRVTVAVGGALAAAVLLAALYRLPAQQTGPTGMPIPASALQPTAPSPLVWGAYLRADRSLSVPDLRVEIAKIPTWVGLSLLLVIGVLVLPQAQIASQTSLGKNQILAGRPETPSELC